MREGCNDLNSGTTDCELFIYYLLCVRVLIYLDHVISVSRMRLTTENDILLTKGVKRTCGFASCSQSTNQETLHHELAIDLLSSQSITLKWMLV